MAELKIVTKPSKFRSVCKILDKRKYAIYSRDSKKREITISFHNTKQPKTINESRRSIQRIDGVENILRIGPYLKRKHTPIEDSYKRKRRIIIFDIDSTLTRGIETIHHSIPTILKEIKDLGIWSCLATGRSLPDLQGLINKLAVERYGIAENGGIIVGFGADGYTEYGNRTEPDKMLDYLNENYSVREDMEQGLRITEVILLQQEDLDDQIGEARRQTRARVSVHKSTNSVHISQRNIDKGSAVSELLNRLASGNAYTMAVGDSDMDIPMFENVTHSYAMGNAKQNVKDKCNEVLKGDYEKSIQDLHKRLESQ